MTTSPEKRERVVWVTGAAGGLGPGICHRLARAGYTLALHVHTSHDRARALVDELHEEGRRAIVTTGDLSDENLARQALRSIEAELGPLWGVVHLAGPYVARTVAEHTRRQFDRMVHGNLTTFFEVVRAVVPAMRERGEGRIIGVGMVGAHQTTPMINNGPHLAAKAGLVALARTLALEEAPHGITVNVINPGHIMHKSLPRPQARGKSAGPDHPMGVHGSYDDLAEGFLYLLDPASSYVTGAVLEITGGWAGRYTMDDPIS